MIIVGGHFELDPSERDAFIASRHEVMAASRAEHGCLDYTFAPDPIDPGRVILFERWEDQDALDAHLVKLRSGGQLDDGGISPKRTSVALYDVAGTRTIG